MFNKENKQLPILVRHSVQRSGEDTLPGHYCYDQNVWVIEKGDVVMPIVQVVSNISELVTKTYIAKETDDDSDYVMLLEATTKTEAKPERDDEEKQPILGMLEMYTKTKVQRERDDT